MTDSFFGIAVLIVALMVVPALALWVLLVTGSVLLWLAAEVVGFLSGLGASRRAQAATVRRYRRQRERRPRRGRRPKA